MNAMIWPPHLCNPDYMPGSLKYRIKELLNILIKLCRLSITKKQRIWTISIHVFNIVFLIIIFFLFYKTNNKKERIISIKVIIFSFSFFCLFGKVLQNHTTYF